MKTKSHPLVLGYLERIASSAFSEFPKQITGLVHGRHGVYALYKGDRLYYVGLATNLRNRIKQHLRDKHAGKWNRFSLYLVRKAEHIKELETMILRIADPKGNSTKGALPGAENLWGALHSSIRAEQDRQVQDLFGITRKKKPRRTKKTKRSEAARKANASRQPAMAPYVTKRFQIRTTYRGIQHKAMVEKNGTITMGGKTYTSPSSAGSAVRGGKSTNGWTFWKHKNANGEWVQLNTLKRNQPK